MNFDAYDETRVFINAKCGNSGGKVPGKRVLEFEPTNLRGVNKRIFQFAWSAPMALNSNDNDCDNAYLTSSSS